MNENVQLTKQYFDALSKGNMEFVASVFADHVIWHQPGNSIVSGIIKGKEALFAHLGRFMELSQGTFAIDAVDYLAPNGNMVSAAIHFKAKAHGKSMAMKGMDLMRFENGKIVEVWLFSEDGTAEDDFWTAMSKA
ncbi:nuclear transport factor 2 family protein [Flavobacterium sp. '19STA2R22 D10 B1']|uniref:nuclear transport factor 2 family protein n=1 Tax=Flavobacterium aerium TaxID=3037261 RepID=UPI00278C2A07|nr:nuclear transport factor 2 family protein [Flavobacterium sp. '19STA2R22 D10 B1']